MGVDFAELRPPDPGKCLAGWSPNQHVDSRCDRAETKPGGKCFRRQRGNVARNRVAGIIRMEIPAVRCRCVRIQLYRRRELETSGPESKRQPATPGKQVEDTRACPVREPGDFPANVGDTLHRAFRPFADASKSSCWGLKFSCSRWSRISRAIRGDFLNPRSRQKSSKRSASSGDIRT